MDDTPTVMKFEILPNEIIINIFQHLNALDLFNAFDGFNFRFQRLIYNIPLSIHYQHVTKMIFDQFCNRMISNPAIKNQIISLQLSNVNDTCRQINAFLSLFSLDKFPYLRSLIFIDAENNEMDRMASMLPSLSNLDYFCCNRWSISDKTIPTLALSNLRKLVIREFSISSLLNQKLTSITHMTVSRCYLDKIKKIFSCTPLLKCFNMGILCSSGVSSNDALDSPNFQAVSLTQLSFYTEELEFNGLKYLLKQTPNLKTLIFSDMSDEGYLLRPDDWQDLIISLLPHLYTFKFHFTIFLRK